MKKFPNTTMKNLTPTQVFAGAISVAVAVAVIGGLIVAGSPQAERMRRADQQRLSDLQQISYAVDLYWNRQDKLPATLQDLTTSPDVYIQSVRDLFRQHPGQIAAMIMEPARMDEPRDNFLAGARRICHENGALFIFDEMITGFRWHRHGAQHVYAVDPDLACFGKAMANGFSVSALAGKREFMRLGGVETIKVDVRIIAATNVELRKMMEEGKFREDLFYRLHVITVQLPALRERRDDVPLLAGRFLRRFAATYDRALEGFSEPALRLLEQYPWPGNVRELEHVVERAVILATDARLGPEDLPPAIRLGRASPSADVMVPAGSSLQEVERLAILQTLELTDWNKRQAARILGIHRPTLYNKLRKHRLWRREDRVRHDPVESPSCTPPPTLSTPALRRNWPKLSSKSSSSVDEKVKALCW